MEDFDNALLKMSATDVALKLKSDDPKVLSSLIIDLMKLAVGQTEENGPAKWPNVKSVDDIKSGKMRAAASRLFSEIATFEEGGVIKKLLQQFLGADEDSLCEGAKLMAGLPYNSGMVLAWLWVHKPVAKLTMRLTSPETLVNRIAACMELSQKSLPLILVGLTSLAHLVGSSKDLRIEVKKHDDIFRTLNQALSERTVRTLPYEIVGAIRVRASDFLHAAGAQKDLEIWLVQQGYVEAVARILATCRQRPYDTPVFKCFMGLTQMLENQEVCTMVRERGGIKTLEPVSGVLNGIDATIWGIMKAQIMEDKLGARPYTAEEKKQTRRWANDGLSTPKVCAYSGCEVAESNRSDVSLKRCSRCHLAYYCSPEHQKLHWPEHKKACKAASAAQASQEL